MANRLTSGISEDRDFIWPTIKRSDFSASGRYGPALASLDKLLSAASTEEIHRKHWARCIASGSTLPASDYETAKRRFSSDIKMLLVRESEAARHWRKGPIDYPSAHREYQKSAKNDVGRIKSTIDDLRRFDRKHAFLLRSALDHAFQDFLSDEKVRRIKRSDPNTQNGSKWRTVSGPTVRENEFQFLSRVSLFHLDHLLDAWEREIDTFFKPWRSDWLEFGALRFDQAVTPKAAAKMNIAQLGLIARLSSRLRDFSEGFGIRVYGTGQPIPTHGKPCWPIVAEFVNYALEPANSHTGDTIRRVWQGFEKRHKVKLQSWPRPAKAESQVQKI